MAMSRTFLYLLILFCLGAAVLDGAINFGIAAAMYHSADNVRVWKLPNTLAGDTAVTIFVQNTLTWVIAGASVRADVRKGKYGIRPLPWNHKWDTGWYYWLCRGNMDLTSSRLGFFPRLVAAVIRGLAFSALTFLPSWPIAVGALAGTYGSDTIGGWPAPPIYKLIFAACLGFVFTPIPAYIALKQAGRDASGTGGSGLPTSDRYKDTGQMELNGRS
eukprot:jgi/Chlat1/9272/Chrsp99S09296